MTTKAKKNHIDLEVLQEAVLFLLEQQHGSGDAADRAAELRERLQGESDAGEG